MRNFIFLIALLTGFATLAAQVNTRCVKDAATGEITGVRTETPYVIASVSKVFTTHWAIVQLGPKYRYTTKLHVTPVGQNIYDVHIEGSLFPYFDRSAYQFMIGELNKLNVKSINFLTYDEDFVYASDMRTKPKLAHGNGVQSTIDIMKELRADTTTINRDLAALNSKVLALEQMVLPRTLTLTIRDIHFVSKRDFQPTALTQTYALKSSEISRSLKELNRNSHNYASENIFRKLARSQDYDDFLVNQLKVPQEEFVIYNGSGYPVTDANGKYYNSASCRVVVEMISDLRQNMLKNNMEYKDIMPVAGKDTSSDGQSTVSQIYGNDKTNGVLIAKTGSVANAIALAGMVSTESSTVYFHTSFDVERTAADREQAYQRIKDWIMNDLIGNKKKGDLANYQPKSFLPFDKQSTLVPLGPAGRLR